MNTKTKNTFDLSNISCDEMRTASGKYLVPLGFYTLAFATIFFGRVDSIFDWFGNCVYFFLCILITIHALKAKFFYYDSDREQLHIRSMFERKVIHKSKMVRIHASKMFWLTRTVTISYINEKDEKRWIILQAL